MYKQFIRIDVNVILKIIKNGKMNPKNDPILLLALMLLFKFVFLFLLKGH